MYADMTGRCPACLSHDVFGFERTCTGRAYYCHDCGTRWSLSVEDEVSNLLEVCADGMVRIFSPGERT
jgi:hypothetical protein